MNLIASVIAVAARILLAVASLFLVLCLRVVGRAIVAGVLIWSLLRGRRPVLHTATFKRASQYGARAWGGARASAGSGEVVDVEVREVSPTPQRLDP
jgi:ABC-type uncharacterized transport system permease subunit